MTRDVPELGAWQLWFVVYKLWHAWSLARSNWHKSDVARCFFWVLPSLHLSTTSCLQSIARCLTPLKRKVLIEGRSFNAQAINWSFPPGVPTVRSPGNTSDLVIPSSMCPNSLLLLCYKCWIVGSEVRGCQVQRPLGQNFRVKELILRGKTLGISWGWVKTRKRASDQVQIAIYCLLCKIQRASILKWVLSNLLFCCMYCSVSVCTGFKLLIWSYFTVLSCPIEITCSQNLVLDDAATAETTSLPLHVAWNRLISRSISSYQAGLGQRDRQANANWIWPWISKLLVCFQSLIRHYALCCQSNEGSHSVIRTSHFLHAMYSLVQKWCWSWDCVQSNADTNLHNLLLKQSHTSSCKQVPYMWLQTFAPPWKSRDWTRTGSVQGTKWWKTGHFRRRSRVLRGTEYLWQEELGLWAVTCAHILCSEETM